MAYLRKGSSIPEKGKGAKLSSKMTRFIDEYFAPSDGSQPLVGSSAVLRAGYKTSNPNRLATELLRHPLVQPEIEKRLADMKEQGEVTKEYIIQKLVSIVEDTEKGNPNAALRGLELLGKHLGLYKERTEISGPDGEAIRMEQKVKEDVADFTSRLSRLSAAGGTGGVSSFPKPGSKGSA